MAWLEAYTRGWRWLVIPALVSCTLPCQAGAQASVDSAQPGPAMHLRITLPPDIPYKKFTRRKKFLHVTGDFIRMSGDSLFLQLQNVQQRAIPLADIIKIERRAYHYSRMAMEIWPPVNWWLGPALFGMPLNDGRAKPDWEPIEIQELYLRTGGAEPSGTTLHYASKPTIRDRDLQRKGFRRWRIGVQPVYGFAIPKPLRSDGGGGIYYGCKVRTTIPRYSQMTFDLALLRSDVYPDRDENYRIKSTTLMLLANYYVFGPTDALFISGGYGVYRNHHTGKIVQNNRFQTAQGLNAGAGINIHLWDRMAIDVELFRRHFVKDAHYWTFGAGLLVWVN